MRRAVGTGVQRHIAAEDCRRTIARIVVGEGTDASPHLAQRLQARAGLAWKDVVGAAHGERQAVALRQHNAGRPDLDIDLIDLARCELLLLVMGVIGAIRQGELRIQLAVRPIRKGRYPVILSGGPYGKWLHFEDGYKTAWKRRSRPRGACAAAGHPEEVKVSRNRA